MTGGIRIGRIFGINVYVDWSWLLIFVLVTSSLSSLFGSIHPFWSPLLRLGTSLVASLLFFGSVLAHELGHSLVARRNGIPVSRITLFLFGGVASIEREPDSPKAEFLMAISGPLTSIVIGVVLTFIASLSIPMAAPLTDPLALLSAMGPGATLFFWLGSVNVSLGLFNLLPGFPLDGGRVLRSIVWAISDNLVTATRWASAVGQAFAWVMIISGLAAIFGLGVPLVGGSVLDGLWLTFIGWFLSAAARQSYQHVLVQDLLGDVLVSQIMRRNPLTVSSDISVQSLVYDYVMGTDERAFPVVDDGTVVGLVSLDDIRKVSRHDWPTTLVRQIMTPVENLVWVSPDDDAARALDKLSQRDVNQLPVLQDGALVGLLRRQDIMRWLQIQSGTPM